MNQLKFDFLCTAKPHDKKVILTSHYFKVNIIQDIKNVFAKIMDIGLGMERMSYLSLGYDPGVGLPPIIKGIPLP
jgi:hypothetical protein